MAASFLDKGLEDEEYIDMEISSFSNFCNSRNSREFEFQMSSVSIEREPTTSPADELFYKGKLLPLHLPPNLLQISNSGSDSVYGDNNGMFEEFYSTPLATTVTTPTSTSTPFESCNISPCESCSVSRELNPDEYSFFEYSTEVTRSIGKNPKKSWTKKLKLSSKLKASRAYLKALFGKSGCSDESSAAAKDGNETTLSKPKGRSDSYKKSSKENQFKHINQDKGKLTDENNGNGNRHRRSFSMTIKRYSGNKSSTSSSSSSSSSNSNGFQYPQFLKRSSSANAEIESPIQGAIAHCKRSQMSSRKTVGKVGFYSLSASNIAVCEDQERPDLCRG